MFISFTNVWMILNYFRKIQSEWSMQIVADATFRVCDRDIGLVGIGIVLPGGKFQPLNYSLVPTESAKSYSLAWASYEKSAIYFATKFRHCEDRACSTCSSIDTVLHAPRVRDLLRSDAIQKEEASPGRLLHFGQQQSLSKCSFEQHGSAGFKMCHPSRR